jgi:hypothetical protein
MNGYQISASRDGFMPLRIPRNCALEIKPLVFVMSKIVCYRNM